MLKKLRIKFICINMMTVAVMLCVMFGMVYSFFQTRLEEESVSMMRQIAASPHSVDGFQDGANSINTPYFVLDADKHGGLIASEGQYYEVPDDEKLEVLYKQANASESITGILKAYNLRYYRQDSPWGQRIVFADIIGERLTLRWLLEGMLAIGAVSLLIFLGISLLLARWAVRPVDKAWKQQRQFVADASHELKTPLTVIMSNAQLLADASCSEEDRQRFGGNILSTSYKMRELVEGLLDLARADNAPDRTCLEKLDFSKLVSDAVLPFEPVFFEQGLTLESEVAEGISVNGNSQHLKQLVGILLDNAQKYSLPGKVKLRLEKPEHGKCLLTVSNPAEDMSREELKDIFKRFYRADKARGGGNGYGLGLSIAENVAQEHKGKIWAESRNGIFSMKVQLPAQ